jgi:hypothetical protein
MAGDVITRDRLLALISFDPGTGEFRWKAGRTGVTAGSVAGTLTKAGYRRIEADGRSYMAHRLAWLIQHGTWPAQEIDHANGERDDNRVCNLRVATRVENNRNVSQSRLNTSGYKGVFLVPDQPSRPWRAQIRVDGRRISLGSFVSPEAAHQAYQDAARRHHGEFANFGARS